MIQRVKPKFEELECCRVCRGAVRKDAVQDQLFQPRVPVRGTSLIQSRAYAVPFQFGPHGAAGKDGICGREAAGWCLHLVPARTVKGTGQLVIGVGQPQAGLILAGV
ncbi:hypothetical protein [Flexibacterium corallicola]|uniref:hypothetical protein n=1 Tax=Flexibacterium corallicola TaxID=3037259 RepID=UPI00286EB995|nr:hypothetical protein [Pseudovibrio sp. M1P-2-3]